ncbi:MAG TPA: protein kinase [Gemmataceae bacterium]|nr:protein kinase [Gemmataceae bacterium]
MADIDIKALTQLMLKVGLITETQLQEAWDEAGHRGGEPGVLLGVLQRKSYVTPFQVNKLLKGETDGYILGGYRILYKIASGSFGRVYRAEDPHTGRIVAIKVLRRRWSDDEHTIELFEREGHVGLSLRHPNIVETVTVNRDPASGQYFIIMEFVEGGNLRDFMGIRKKLDPAEAIRFTEDAASGLVYAYSRGVTHRDIKPTNVLISTQGTVKLVDFGLAGIFTRKGLELEGGEKLDRTVDYAGLEKATGVKSGDIRSDIYFLGAVVYEMLTGRSPLALTKDPRQRMNKRRFDNVQPMRRDEVSGPASLFQLVERMMALDPYQRYQTPAQLLDAVREARKDIEGVSKTDDAKPSVPSVFVVEKNERLQDAMRVDFKSLGYRVFISADPMRAIDRFRMVPYDALILDAGTTGEEGRLIFERIMKEAQRRELSCEGILILSEEQAEWAAEVASLPQVAVMVRPITLQRVRQKLQELVPSQGASEE